jgi:hypothetical protein
MILTPLNIQLAIIKAYYALAKKSVKYYTGLALGKNNTCLFKEIRLLRAYVDILKNFEIVGSTHGCHCCIEGDYTFLFNEDSSVTLANLQLLHNNEGTLIYNENTYSITYYYDNFNQNLVITIPEIDVTLNFTEVSFTENCNITTNLQSPVEVTYLTVTGTGVPSPEDNLGPFLAIYDESNNITSFVYQFNLEALNNPELIVSSWNTLWGPDGWLLSYDGTSFIMNSPLDDTNYFGWSFYFSQYENTEEVIYQESFAPISYITDITTDNPCTPTTIEQTCLTNNQVSKIIAHINKLVR